MTSIPVELETLSPLSYGSLPVSGGVATLPDVIADRAVAFALCAALGLMWNRVTMPLRKDYRRDLAAMPWRSSLFVTSDPRLLPPLARRSALDAEGGYQASLAKASASGNFKDFFTVQEIPHGVVFSGAIFHCDPFAVAGRDEFVIRVGNNRAGIVRVRRGAHDSVHLNAATAQLFGRRLPVERVYLHDIQRSPEVSLAEAEKETGQWH